jgi:hypothetical protein
MGYISHHVLLVMSRALTFQGKAETGPRGELQGIFCPANWFCPVTLWSGL